MVHHHNLVVAVKCKGRVLREFVEWGDRYTVLPFGSEYSLLLKNLATRNVVANIEIDGQDIQKHGNGFLVGPGEEIEIERFVDNLYDGHRFRFIKKTEEISNFRGDRVDDGLIRVKFRYEQQKSQTGWWSDSVTYSNGGPYIYHLGNQPFSGTGDPMIRDDVTISSSCSESVKSQSLGSSHAMFANRALEDGITVKGSQSGQKFVDASVGRLETESHVIVIGLRGQTHTQPVQNLVTVKTRIRCTTCGRSSKSGHKFCNNCGAALV